jgi:Cupin domain
LASEDFQELDFSPEISFGWLACHTPSIALPVRIAGYSYRFIREGRGAWTVNGKTFEGGAGDIFVIEAGEVHSFKVVGDSPLVQLDVHISPRLIQENLYSVRSP